MKIKVLKRMVSLGKQLEVGDVVDATGWRHIKALVSNRYIEIVTEEAPVVEKTEPKKSAKKSAPVSEKPVEAPVIEEKPVVAEVKSEE